MVAWERRAPIIQHPDETPFRKVILYLILGQVGQTKPRQGRIQPQGDVVEHQLPIDPHSQFMPTFLELPTVKALRMLEGGD